MNDYQYRCFNCSAVFSAASIEANFTYLCPICGKAERNRPLEGVLWIEHDYDRFSRIISRSDFLKNSPGEIWRYPALWPLDFSRLTGASSSGEHSFDLFHRLRLPSHPVSTVSAPGGLVRIFDDTRNPTLSFKDRASILVCLKAQQLGFAEIAAASTGNAASSLAGICARLGLRAHLFVPASIPPAKRIQIQAYGASIYVVAGSYDEAFDLSLEISRERNWFNRNTAYNPLTIEGKKSGAFDIFLANQGELPDAIFVPVGDGVIIAGLFKGFWELQRLGWIEKIPRLIAVQAEGSDAVVQFFRTGQFVFREAFSIADSICAGAPRNLYMAAYAVKQSQGDAMSVSDDEIAAAQKCVANDWGILVEPAAAASFAGYLKYLSHRDIRGEKMMVMFTGHGLKDMATLERWNEPCQARSPHEWRAHFKSSSQQM
ncbi:MAG: threonine synthase [Candidatus Zhuqueibacterota bacterium]